MGNTNWLSGALGRTLSFKQVEKKKWTPQVGRQYFVVLPNDFFVVNYPHVQDLNEVPIWVYAFAELDLVFNVFEAAQERLTQLRRRAQDACEAVIMKGPNAR